MNEAEVERDRLMSEDCDQDFDVYGWAPGCIPRHRYQMSDGSWLCWVSQPIAGWYAETDLPLGAACYIT